MKKTYLKPSVIVEQIVTNPLMAASVLGTEVFTEEDAGEDVEGLACHYNLWDEEEGEY